MQIIVPPLLARLVSPLCSSRSSYIVSTTCVLIHDDPQQAGVASMVRHQASRISILVVLLLCGLQPAGAVRTYAAQRTGSFPTLHIPISAPGYAVPSLPSSNHRVRPRTVTPASGGDQPGYACSTSDYAHDNSVTIRDRQHWTSQRMVRSRATSTTIPVQQTRRPPARRRVDVGQSCRTLD